MYASLKPFDMKELLARITVQLRRSSRREPSAVLSCGDLKLDMPSHKLAVKDILVKLTKTEYDLDQMCRFTAIIFF